MSDLDFLARIAARALRDRGFRRLRSTDIPRPRGLSDRDARSHRRLVRQHFAVMVAA